MTLLRHTYQRDKQTVNPNSVCVVEVHVTLHYFCHDEHTLIRIGAKVPNSVGEMFLSECARVSGLVKIGRDKMPTDNTLSLQQHQKVLKWWGLTHWIFHLVHDQQLLVLPTKLQFTYYLFNHLYPKTEVPVNQHLLKASVWELPHRCLWILFRLSVVR